MRDRTKRLASLHGLTPPPPQPSALSPGRAWQPRAPHREGAGEEHVEADARTQVVSEEAAEAEGEVQAGAEP